MSSTAMRTSEKKINVNLMLRSTLTVWEILFYLYLRLLQNQMRRCVSVSCMCVQYRDRSRTQTVYKDDKDGSPKVKPKYLNRPLVAGCCTGHKPLHVSGWDMTQTKKSKYKSDTFLPKMMSVILGNSQPSSIKGGKKTPSNSKSAI